MHSVRATLKAFVAAAVLASATASASPDSAAVDQRLIDAQIAAKESVEPSRKEISIGCTTAPLPTTPEGPTWRATVDEEFLGQRSRFEMIAWRKPCQTPGDYQLLLTLRPTHGPTAIFSPFAVSQGGRYYNTFTVINEAGAAFNNSLATTTTVLLKYNGPRAEAFDDEAALTIVLISLGGPSINLAVPAVTLTGTPPPPPALVVDGRMRGTFFDPTRSGQGFLFDYVPGEQPLLVGGWYTASPDEEKEHEQAWYTLVGRILGNVVEFDVQATANVRFMRPSQVRTTSVGTARLTFLSCTEARFEYDLPGFEHEGEANLVRLTPAPEGCPP